MNSSYQVFFRPYHSNRFKGWYRFLVTKYVGRNRETLYYGVGESFSQALERVNAYFRGETINKSVYILKDKEKGESNV